MYYNSKYTAKINSKYFFVASEDNYNNTTVYLASYDKDDTDFNKIPIPCNNQYVYGNRKCVYFSGWLYIIDIKNSKIEKHINEIDKLYFLTNSIICIIKRKNRFDEIIKIDINDLSIESLGSMVYRNMSR